MTEIKRLLCVHQGSELYGSDRVFLQSVKIFRDIWPNAVITVHVPSQGPLIDAVKPFVDHMIIGNMFVLRLARLHPRFWRNLLLLPSAFRFAWKNINDNDCVYLSTVTVAGYLMAARFSKRKVILHVHEVLSGLIGFGLKFFIRISKAHVITNSKATANGVSTTSTVVLNGIDDTATTQDMPTLPLRLFLPGRINANKGHDVAINAMKILSDQGFNDIRLDIVGNVFDDQHHFLNHLIAKVKTCSLEKNIFFHDFQTDLSEFYKNAHIVLMPSTKAESFGLVAVEGMMWSRPVIASQIGALPEIVLREETGFLLRSDNAQDLAEAIRKYSIHPSLLKHHGDAGRIRYNQLFTTKHYSTHFIRAVTSCI